MKESPSSPNRSLKVDWWKMAPFKIGVLNFPGIASCSPLIMSLKFNFMLMGPIDIVGMYLLAFVLMVEFNQFTPSFWKVTGASVSSH